MSNNSNTTYTASAADLNHHNLARKYAQNYIDNVLKYKSQGEMSTEIKQEAKNRYNLHDNERMVENIVRNVAMDSRTESQSFIDPNTGHEVINYYHVKVKPEYQDKTTPNYY
jgi:hypothetical protein